MPYDRRNTPESSDVDVPGDDWNTFLDAFSRQHQGWLVTIEISSPAAAQVEARERKLLGVSLDRIGGRPNAYIETGDDRGSLLTHAVPRVTRLLFLRSKSGAHRGLEMFSSDGTSTRVLFRSAIMPEVVNGLNAA